MFHVMLNNVFLWQYLDLMMFSQKWFWVSVLLRYTQLRRCVFSNRQIPIKSKEHMSVLCHVCVFCLFVYNVSCFVTFWLIKTFITYLYFLWCYVTALSKVKGRTYVFVSAIFLMCSFKDVIPCCRSSWLLLVIVLYIVYVLL